MVYKLARTLMAACAVAILVMAGHDLAVGTLSLATSALALACLGAVRGLWVLYGIMEEADMR